MERPFDVAQCRNVFLILRRGGCQDQRGVEGKDDVEVQRGVVQELRSPPMWPQATISRPLNPYQTFSFPSDPKTTTRECSIVMQPSTIFFRSFLFLLPPALLGTLYLYLYPLVKQCGFPSAPTGKAPFRLLALADPQLEGDTSLPDPNSSLLPSLERIWSQAQSGDFGRLSEEGGRLWRDDLPKAFATYRKMLDLWGNDLYLAHVYRSMKWATEPTHVAVLGDLLGSQWIGDEEFASRSSRFWNRVFSDGEKVSHDIMYAEKTKVEVLGKDRSWRNKIISVAGNHDVGYAGDLDQDRVRRFEDAFGRVNWEVRLKIDDSKTSSQSTKESPPALRLIVLNSMNLDEPAKDPDLLEDSLDFLNRKLYWEIPPSNTGTVLLTHIPMHKEAGICVDGPFFDYFPEHHGGGVKEQNHLSEDISERILDGIVGPERNRKAIILNGHDHEGCLVHHSRLKEIDVEALIDNSPPSEDKWEATKYTESSLQGSNSSLIGVREVTVRSMMGEFGGNAGLLSAWWDEGAKEWDFQYSDCMCGVQHIWWAVHVLDIIAIGLGIVGLVSAAVEDLGRSPRRIPTEKKTI